MEYFTEVDWRGIFSLETPILEIFIRGTFIYLGLFIMLRIVLKRESSNLGITDVLVVVLIADAAQNGMADDYKSITDGLILVATIIFWSHFLNWLGYKYKWVNKLIHSTPLLLIENGRFNHHNMKKEFITEMELMSQVRKEGIDDVSKVQKAFMELDGNISVIPYEEK